MKKERMPSLLVHVLNCNDYADYEFESTFLNLIATESEKLRTKDGVRIFKSKHYILTDLPLTSSVWRFPLSFSMFSF